MRRRIDERRADPAPPKFRLDEEAIELTADQCCKTGHAALEFGDQHLPIRHLRWRQMDRFRMRQQLLAVVRQGERRPPLQLFKLLALIGLREANAQQVNGL